MRCRFIFSSAVDVKCKTGRIGSFSNGDIICVPLFRLSSAGSCHWIICVRSWFIAASVTKYTWQWCYFSHTMLIHTVTNCFDCTLYFVPHDLNVVHLLTDMFSVNLQVRTLWLHRVHFLRNILHGTTRLCWYSWFSIICVFRSQNCIHFVDEKSFSSTGVGTSGPFGGQLVSKSVLTRLAAWRWRRGGGESRLQMWSGLGEGKLGMKYVIS